jgi:hypothetical protein
VRWIRNFLLALFVTTGLGLAAIYGFGERFLPPLPLIISKTLGTGFLCVIGVPLTILAATRILSCYVTVGPHGICRIRSIPMGHHAMVQRRVFPWKEIQELLYVEGCPLGGRSWRVLIVQSIAEQKEIIGIADEVSRARLAETIGAWGKRLVEVSEPGRPRLADDLNVSPTLLTGSKS